MRRRSALGLKVKLREFGIRLPPRVSLTAVVAIEAAAMHADIAS